MAEEHNPVVLLVHGAWHRPLHYRSLISALQASGFTVLAPPLASSGYDDSIDTKSHLDDMKRIHDALLPVLDRGRTVVGIAHSYGTVPMARAMLGQSVADRASRGLAGGIISAIFIAPVPLLAKGISMLEASGGRWPTSWFHDVTETRLPLKPDLAKDAFYSGVEQSLQDEAAAYWCAQSSLPLTTPIIGTPQDLDIPKALVVCTNDKIVPRELQVLCAETWGARQVEVASGHSPWMHDSLRKQLVELVVEEAAKV